MGGGTLFLLLVALAAFGWYLARARANVIWATQRADMHSLPRHHGTYVAICAFLPSALLACLFLISLPSYIHDQVLATLPAETLALPPAQIELVYRNIESLALGGQVAGTPGEVEKNAAELYKSLAATGRMVMWLLVVSLSLIGASIAYRQVKVGLPAMNRVEKVVGWLLVASSIIAVLTTAGIVLSLMFETSRFFAKVPVFEFLFGLNWSPQTALRADQAGSSGAFGAVPLFTGTLLITILALLVAVPVGLMAAIYLAEYANSHVRAIAKPILEILAGIPTVVYGFFAAITVAPVVSQFGEAMDWTVSPNSALAAGLVMGIMLVPFISSLSDDVINAVPQQLRDGSYGMGATKSETIRFVVLPAALPGIVASIVLAASKAIGETMIVVMAAGIGATLTANPFDAVTTVTVQIHALLVGDQEFDSPKTLASFALGFVLFFVTLTLNMFAQRVVKKYREKYD